MNTIKLTNRIVSCFRQSYCSCHWQQHPLFGIRNRHRSYRGTREIGIILFGLWLTVTIDYSE